MMNKEEQTLLLKFHYNYSSPILLINQKERLNILILYTKYRFSNLMRTPATQDLYDLSIMSAQT